MQVIRDILWLVKSFIAGNNYSEEWEKNQGERV